jgi:hypothetical protein
MSGTKRLEVQRKLKQTIFMNWPYRKLKDSKILEANLRFVSNFSTQPRGMMSVVSGMQVQRGSSSQPSSTAG